LDDIWKWVNIMSGILQSTVANFRSFGISVTAPNATLYSDATYYYVAYKTPGTFTNNFVVSGGTLTADVLSVAGGGIGGIVSGNNFSGGGGAGGIVYLTSQSLGSGSYTVTVGQGGVSTTPLAGGNSQFGSLTASVGGAAGGGTAAALVGGSGGGGSNLNTTASAGTAGQGNAGGAGRSTGGATSQSGGGGGGFGGVGSAGTSGTGGNGGAGSTSASAFYPLLIAANINSGLIGGGGGGGATTTAGTASAGGGAGSINFSTPVNGIANTGGGGGGTNANAGFTAEGGAGGSGTIIVRYTRSQVGG
jgi:hypothetical protein